VAVTSRDEPAAEVDLVAIELRMIRLRMRQPFRAHHGVEADRDILLVRAISAEGEGWGECVAPTEPGYSPEYVDGAREILRRFLVPKALGELAPDVAGHPMAKAALEMALLDLQLRQAGRSFADYFGATRTHVDAGVAVGLAATTEGLVDEVTRRVEEGYKRVKLKIEPGSDVEPVAAVRSAFPDLPLQVDANGAYRAEDTEQLRALDDVNLLMIEQPLPPDDLVGHARLAGHLSTPICLDESITSVATATTALALKACSIVNVKAGRVGGYGEAKRLHDLCLTNEVPAWVGGMLETGLGRAANLALAALPGFTLVGDLSASDRYWEEDITDPFVLDDGRLEVPSGPGLGVVPDPERLRAATTWSETLD
jgi:O-succinylbenzoate synthase